MGIERANKGEAGPAPLAEACPWGHSEDTGFSLFTTVASLAGATVAMLLMSAATQFLLPLTSIAVVAGLVVAVMVARRIAWHGVSFAATEQGLATIKHGKVKTLIPWNDITLLARAGWSDRVTVEGKDGARISIPNLRAFGASFALERDPVLQEIAQRLPYAARLLPERSEKRPWPAFSIEAVHWLGVMFAVPAAILPLVFAYQAIPASVALALVGTVCILLSAHHRHRADRPWLWNPDVVEPEELIPAHELLLADPDREPIPLEEGYEYEQLPAQSYPLHDNAASLLPLLGFVVPCVSLWHGFLSVLIIAFFSYLIWQIKTGGPKPLRFRYQDDKLWFPDGNWMLYVPEPATAEDGSTRPGWEVVRGRWRHVEIDRRTLYRTDRPIYRPESPWRDLWRGRL